MTTTPTPEISITIPAATVTFADTTVDAITASGLSQSTAAVIQRSLARTVVIVTIPDVNDTSVRLPSGADIGDEVEVHNHNSASVTVFMATDETFYGQPGDSTVTGMIVAATSGGRFRKISASDWGRS